MDVMNHKTNFFAAGTLALLAFSGLPRAAAGPRAHRARARTPRTAFRSITLAGGIEAPRPGVAGAGSCGR